MVQKKKYQLSDSNIAGYGRPNWNIVGEDVAPEPAVEPSEPDMGGYTVNNTYTVLVSALNVRTGPGKAYELVGYDNLTQDGKRHASMFGALLRGTRVTCLDVKKEGDNVWMEIPSGWICARWGDNVYVG